MSRKTRKNAFLGALQAGICYAILFTVISSQKPVRPVT